MFCDEDGAREFNKSCTCPACETELPGKYDIVRVDLQPGEDYKSVGYIPTFLLLLIVLQMVLAGQRPETILEICSRSLSFWTYQVGWAYPMSHFYVSLGPPRKNISGVQCYKGQREGTANGKLL